MTTTNQSRTDAGKAERIAWLPIADEAALDDDLRALFGKARERLGYIPNVFKVYASRPERFRKWRAHLNEVTRGESELSAAEREMIAVAVSSQNHCLYCIVSHGAELRLLLEDPIQADRITLDYRRAMLDPRTRAMLDYAVKLTMTPVDCDEADLNALRAAGFSDAAIFDIIETASMFNFTNRLMSGTGTLPNPEYHSLGR